MTFLGTVVVVVVVVVVDVVELTASDLEVVPPDGATVVDTVVSMGPDSGATTGDEVVVVGIAVTEICCEAAAAAYSSLPA